MSSSLGKLYYTPTSCGFASFIAATVSGVPFDSEQVDIKAHKTAGGEDFYKINPKGNVPTLVTSKGMLNEGAAVLQYIADQAPQSGLAPANGTFERYQLQEALNFVCSELHSCIGGQFNPSLSDEQKAPLKAKADSRIKYFEENFLAKNSPFFDPSKPSVAGIYAYIVGTWVPYVGMDISKYPQFQKFVEAFKNSEAVQKATANSSK